MDHVMYAIQKRVGWCKGYLQPTSSANTISCVSVFTSSSALPSNKPQKTERTDGEMLGENMEEKIGSMKEHHNSRTTQHK